MKKSIFYFSLFFGWVFASCDSQPQKETITQELELMIKAEKVAEWQGKDVFRYTLDNGTMSVELSNFGGLISKIFVPDQDGNLENVALTFDSIPEFLTKPNPFFGATAGRVANRIAKGKFTHNGQTYTLATNNGENHLHGGVEGFNKKVWDAEPYTNDSILGVKMTYRSPDGEEDIQEL
mgnify:FL=1